MEDKQANDIRRDSGTSVYEMLVGYTGALRRLHEISWLVVTGAKGAGVRRLVSGGGKRAPIFSSVASTAAGESCALHPVVSNHPVSRVFWPRHVRVARTGDRSRSRERFQVRSRVVSFVSSPLFRVDTIVQPYHGCLTAGR